MGDDKNLPYLTARIKKEVNALKGKRVVFTEIRGQSRTQYKGTLTGIFDRVGTITLDEDLYIYDTYAFNYSHLLLKEGTLKPWHKETDKEYLLLKQNN